MDFLYLTSWSLLVAIIAVVCATVYTIVYLLRGNAASRPSNNDKNERQTVLVILYVRAEYKHRLYGLI